MRNACSVLNVKHVQFLRLIIQTSSRFTKLAKATARTSSRRSQRNNPARAIQFLEPAMRWEAAADFQPQYLRGLSYLRLGKGAEAAVEFQKIIDRKGQADLLVSTLYPLATVELARALALSDDAARASKDH